MPILIVTLVLYLPSTPEIQTPRPDPMRVLYGASWVRLGCVLGASWGVLGAPWGRLGGILICSTFLAHFGAPSTFLAHPFGKTHSCARTVCVAKGVC